jgi:hypothetical protein
MDGEVTFISYMFKRIKNEEEEEYDLLEELKLNSYIPISRTNYDENEIKILGFRTESIALKNVTRSERINKRSAKIKSYRERFFRHIDQLPQDLSKVLMKYIIFSICEDKRLLHKACVDLLHSLESERERIHRENVERIFGSYKTERALLKEKREQIRKAERGWLGAESI